MQQPTEPAGARPPYAHTLTGQPASRWEELSAHLDAVAMRAALLASAFGAGTLGRLAGMLHDIGKIARDFQEYIQGRGQSPNHSSAGARLVEELYGEPRDRIAARLVALVIASHHSGLQDVTSGPIVDDAAGAVLPEYGAWRDVVAELPELGPLALRPMPGNPAYSLTFLGRMLFSALVDADSVETRRFVEEGEGTAPEPVVHAPLTALRDRLDRHLACFADRTGPLNAHRATILADARARAALPPGLFTMTVPTGGGKTLAGLAFALDHAIAHGLRRVIYVIPYTSIIEQTAGVFRDALRDPATPDAEPPEVLEHHGTVDRGAGTGEGEQDALKAARRLTENWDAPVVVTTAVQFFESLHADRRSRCRKLHNIAGSVVVLDEAQTLPVALLRPCLAAIDELARNYRASVVLCTATQPAVRVADGFEGGLAIAPERELASDPAALYRALDRVGVRHAGAVEDADIAARFADAERMLCIVNTRAHAQALFALIEDMPGARHLTTLMCPAHRRQVLDGVRADLDVGQPVRLVSTSLIEAGVDVDFPEVWRAENGLDAIACGSVDRNQRATLLLPVSGVAPRAGAWIESPGRRRTGTA